MLWCVWWVSFLTLKIGACTGQAHSHSFRHDLLIKMAILQITPIWQIPQKHLIIAIKLTAALILSHKILYFWGIYERSASRTGHYWAGFHPGTAHTNPTLLHTQTSWIQQDSLWLCIFCTGFLCTAFSARPGFNFAIVELKSPTLCQEKPIHGCHLPPTGQIPALCSSADTETRPACFPHCFLVPYVQLRRETSSVS